MSHALRELVVSTLSICVLLTVAPAQAAAPGDDGPSLESRFARLTSDVWAYGAEFRRRDLEPVPNPNPDAEPQPHRDHPYRMALTADGAKLYVALAGSEGAPGDDVSVFSVTDGVVVGRIRVGRRPNFVRAHPDGRHMLVTSTYSNYISVIDTTTDRVVTEIPADFYCEDIHFAADGRRAWVANRYLGQLLELALDVEGGALSGRVAVRGGFDDQSFVAETPAEGSPREVLRRKCSGGRCHTTTRSGFYAGPDATRAFLSAVRNARPGDPAGSELLRAVLSTDQGGYANERSRPNAHAGGRAVLTTDDEDYKAIAAWIRESADGPGIPVGNPGSRPVSLAPSADGKHLYVSNLGVQEVSVVDLEAGEEVGAIHLQSLPLDVAVFHDAERGAEWLLATSTGAGFGAPKERDPYGGETTERGHPLAQYSVLRDPETSEPLPLERQNVLGPFVAVDGTAAFKMRDLQSDIVAVNANALGLDALDGPPGYLMVANRYEAHDNWVRFTSDSAESLANDVHGDLPPDLMRVVGALPYASDVVGDRLWVAMAGTYQVVEYRIDAAATEPSDLLEPVSVYETGFSPRAIVAGRPGTAAEGRVFATNYYGETLTVVDTSTRESREVAIGAVSPRFPATNSERGAVFVQSTVFSVDQDTACVSCHISDTSDGRSWGAGQVIAQLDDGNMVSGGLLGIPSLRNLWPIQPFYFEGTHTAYDAQLDDAREHTAMVDFVAPTPAGDFTTITHPTPLAERRHVHDEIQEKVNLKPIGPTAADLEERRDEHIRRVTARLFGKAFVFRDFQRFIGEYQSAEARLLPNPFDGANPSVIRGRSLFNDSRVGCSACHVAPDFTDKSRALSAEATRSLPALVSSVPRDRTFTLFSPSAMDRLNGFTPDVEPWEEGRVEEVEGRFTTFQLRGLFDRPFSFLHHGRALSLVEVVATPDHPSLGRFKYPPLRGGELVRSGGMELGFNMIALPEQAGYLVDTHGATSHLNVYEVRDLVNMMKAIE